MGWYDFMTSLCNKPVWDTESHPLTDGTTIQPVPQEAAYVASDLWNGATHGRSGSIMWLYDIAEANSPWAGTMRWANANMRFKPDIAQRVSETNLDMMRLSKELAALQNMKRKIGLVFSRTSLGYNDEHNTATAEVYENCIFGGQRPYFITDTTFEDVKKCELVIVPKSTTNVSQGMLDTIKEYIENGGTVMLLDDISLKYDEYNKPHNEDVVKFIYDNAKKGNTVKEFIEQNDISEITLVDEKTGKLVDNTEWSYVFDDERILVNILYYSYDEESEKTFKLMYNGNEISKVAELRSNKELNGPFTVTPYEPVLYEIKKIKK